MANNYIEDEIDSDEMETESVVDTGDIKSLRRAASGKKKLEQELADLRRELAFTKAGINPDDPKMRYFVRGYDGEMTAEAVRQAALEAGFLATQSAPDPALQQTAAAQQRVALAAEGAAYDDISEQAVLNRMEEALNDGGPDAMFEVARQLGIPIATEM